MRLTCGVKKRAGSWQLEGEKGEGGEEGKFLSHNYRSGPRTRAIRLDTDWTWHIPPSPPPHLPQYTRQGMGHDVDFLVLVQTGPEVPHDLLNHLSTLYTANEWPVRIQYKCLVPTYVFPETKLCGLVISKTEL